MITPATGITFFQGDTLARVMDAYDLDLLKHARVVLVGAGGARGYAEDLARAGLGEIALIDPDTSSAANVGTQAAYVDEIDMPKVAALKRQLLRINPTMRVRTHLCRLEDVQDIGAVLHGCWTPEANEWRDYADTPNLANPLGAFLPLPGEPPRAVVLALATDNFYAHAYGNHLALKHGVPALAAALYARGEGGEIAYSHPDVTRACLRCVQESRYSAYATGFENDTTSHGSPVFIASRLNSLMGMVTMALLHHGSAHPRWGKLLARMGQRNLLLLKLWPDFYLPGIAAATDGASADGLFFDHTVWRPQLPDSPASNGFAQCPDCQGCGDLRLLKGASFSNLPRPQAAIYCHEPD